MKFKNLGLIIAAIFAFSNPIFAANYLRLESNSLMSINPDGDINLLPDGSGVTRTNKALSIGGEPASSALFSVMSSEKGAICAPVMTQSERNSIVSPVKGLQVFNSTSNEPNFYDGTTWQAAGGGGGGGGGATTALDNLASVAINSDLLPGAPNTINIGNGTNFYNRVAARGFDIYNSSGTQVGTVEDPAATKVAIRSLIGDINILSFKDIMLNPNALGPQGGVVNMVSTAGYMKFGDDVANANPGVTIFNDGVTVPATGSHTRLQISNGDSAKNWQFVAGSTSFGFVPGQFSMVLTAGGHIYDIDPTTRFISFGTSNSYQSYAPNSKLDLAGALTVRQMAAPSVSPADTGVIYFDSTAKDFKSSINGGGYNYVVQTDVPIIGNLIPQTGGAPKLGDTTARWNRAYISNLRDGSDVTIFDISNATANDTAGNTSINFGSRVEQDSTDVTAHDYQNRLLKNAVGTTVIDYANEIIKNGSVEILDWSTYFKIRSHLVSAMAVKDTATVNLTNAGADATCTASTNADDNAGSVTIVTVAPDNAGEQCHIGFSETHPSAPVCVFSCADAQCAQDLVANGLYLTTTTTQLKFNTAVQLPNTYTFSFTYHCIENQP